ncbi:hypothetical protein LINPERHAP2_LOCUS24573 [Linum perenne]
MLVAEARAILEATPYATTSPLQCTIMSDCLSLIKCLPSTPDKWPWECYRTLSSIHKLLDEGPQLRFIFTPRRLNQRADWVARKTRIRALPSNWMILLNSEDLPSFHDVPCNLVPIMD